MYAWRSFYLSESVSMRTRVLLFSDYIKRGVSMGPPHYISVPKVWKKLTSTRTNRSGDETFRESSFLSSLYHCSYLRKSKHLYIAMVCV